MRISDWSSDVCSSDLTGSAGTGPRRCQRRSAQEYGFAEVQPPHKGSRRSRLISHIRKQAPAGLRRRVFCVDRNRLVTSGFPEIRRAAVKNPPPNKHSFFLGYFQTKLSKDFLIHK